MTFYDAWALEEEKASVAQLVELLICNQWVGGSSPFAGSKIINGGVPEWLKGTDCKSVVKWLRRFKSSPHHHKTKNLRLTFKKIGDNQIHILFVIIKNVWFLNFYQAGVAQLVEL